MSRTVKGRKPVGYDYWSKRPCSKLGYGRVVKDMTNAVERQQRLQESYKLVRLGVVGEY